MKMKRLLLSLISMLVIGSAWADEVTVADVEVLEGSTGVIYLNLGFDSDVSYRGFQFDMYLPEGITYVSHELGGAEHVSNGEYTFSYNDITAVGETKQHIRFVYTDFSGAVLTEGKLCAIVVKSAESVSAGTYEGQIVDLIVSENENAQLKVPDCNFNLIVGSTFVLDEECTIDPTKTTNSVNIKVKRTIKANEWSTICLPFDMKEEQVISAFGEDVQLAYFDEQARNAVETTIDSDNNVTNIKVSFTKQNLADGIYANYPMLIKTSNDISEFMVTATCAPAEKRDASYSIGHGSSAKTYGFYGTLHAGETIPENGLFLNGNKFYYSTGKTKIKGFRGYFSFTDILADKTVGASAKMSFSINDDAAGIEDLHTIAPAEGIYDLSGRKIKLDGDDLSRLPKGVYIMDGKKVTVK